MPKKELSTRKTTFFQAEISYESEEDTLCPNESFGKKKMHKAEKAEKDLVHNH